MSGATEGTPMAMRTKLTTLDDIAKRSTQPDTTVTTKRVFSDGEKALRRERVAQAKDSLARSVGLRGDHVVAARAALKTYLRDLNTARQPDDAKFAELLAAPFRAPPKKNLNDRRY
jgi:hypothetical protein